MDPPTPNSLPKGGDSTEVVEFKRLSDFYTDKILSQAELKQRSHFFIEFSELLKQEIIRLFSYTIKNKVLTHSGNTDLRKIDEDIGSSVNSIIFSLDQVVEHVTKHNTLIGRPAAEQFSHSIETAAGILSIPAVEITPAIGNAFGIIEKFKKPVTITPEEKKILIDSFSSSQMPSIVTEFIHAMICHCEVSMNSSQNLQRKLNNVEKRLQVQMLAFRNARRDFMCEVDQLREQLRLRSKREAHNLEYEVADVRLFDLEMHTDPESTGVVKERETELKSLLRRERESLERQVDRLCEELESARQSAQLAEDRSNKWQTQLRVLVRFVKQNGLAIPAGIGLDKSVANGITVEQQPEPSNQKMSAEAFAAEVQKARSEAESSLAEKQKLLLQKVHQLIVREQKALSEAFVAALAIAKEGPSTVSANNLASSEALNHKDPIESGALQKAVNERGKDTTEPEDVFRVNFSDTAVNRFTAKVLTSKQLAIKALVELSVASNPSKWGPSGPTAIDSSSELNSKFSLLDIDKTIENLTELQEKNLAEYSKLQIAEIDKLRKQNSELERQVNTKQEIWTNTQTQLIKVSKELKATEDRLSTSQKQSSFYQDRINELEAQLKGSKSVLNSSSVSNKPTQYGKIIELEDLIKNQTAEISIMKLNSSKHEDTLKQLRSKIRQLESENIQLKAVGASDVLEHSTPKQKSIGGSPVDVRNLHERSQGRMNSEFPSDNGSEDEWKPEEISSSPNVLFDSHASLNPDQIHPIAAQLSEALKLPSLYPSNSIEKMALALKAWMRSCMLAEVERISGEGDRKYRITNERLEEERKKTRLLALKLALSPQGSAETSVNSTAGHLEHLLDFGSANRPSHAPPLFSLVGSSSDGIASPLSLKLLREQLQKAAEEDAEAQNNGDSKHRRASLIFDQFVQDVDGTKGGVESIKQQIIDSDHILPSRHNDNIKNMSGRSFSDNPTNHIHSNFMQGNPTTSTTYHMNVNNKVLSQDSSQQGSQANIESPNNDRSNFKSLGASGEVTVASHDKIAFITVANRASSSRPISPAVNGFLNRMQESDRPAPIVVDDSGVPPVMVWSPSMELQKTDLNGTLTSGHINNTSVSSSSNNNNNSLVPILPPTPDSKHINRVKVSHLEQIAFESAFKLWDVSRIWIGQLVRLLSESDPQISQLASNLDYLLSDGAPEPDAVVDVWTSFVAGLPTADTFIDRVIQTHLMKKRRNSTYLKGDSRSNSIGIGTRSSQIKEGENLIMEDVTQERDDGIAEEIDDLEESKISSSRNWFGDDLLSTSSSCFEECELVTDDRIDSNAEPPSIAQGLMNGESESKSKAKRRKNILTLRKPSRHSFLHQFVSSSDQSNSEEDDTDDYSDNLKESDSIMNDDTIEDETQIKEENSINGESTKMTLKDNKNSQKNIQHKSNDLDDNARDNNTNSAYNDNDHTTINKERKKSKRVRKRKQNTGRENKKYNGLEFELAVGEEIEELADALSFASSVAESVLGIANKGDDANEVETWVEGVRLLLTEGDGSPQKLIDRIRGLSHTNRVLKREVKRLKKALKILRLRVQRVYDAYERKNPHLMDESKKAHKSSVMSTSKDPNIMINDNHNNKIDNSSESILQRGRGSKFSDDMHDIPLLSKALNGQVRHARSSRSPDSISNPNNPNGSRAHSPFNDDKINFDRSALVDLDPKLEFSLNSQANKHVEYPNLPSIKSILAANRSAGASAKAAALMGQSSRKPVELPSGINHRQHLTSVATGYIDTGHGLISDVSGVVVKMKEVQTEPNFSSLVGDAVLVVLEKLENAEKMAKKNRKKEKNGENELGLFSPGGKKNRKSIGFSPNVSVGTFSSKENMLFFSSSSSDESESDGNKGMLRSDFGFNNGSSHITRHVTTAIGKSSPESKKSKSVNLRKQSKKSLLSSILDSLFGTGDQTASSSPTAKVVDDAETQPLIEDSMHYDDNDSDGVEGGLQREATAGVLESMAMRKIQKQARRASESGGGVRKSFSTLIKEEGKRSSRRRRRSAISNTSSAPPDSHKSNEQNNDEKKKIDENVLIISPRQRFILPPISNAPNFNADGSVFEADNEVLQQIVSARSGYSNYRGGSKAKSYSSILARASGNSPNEAWLQRNMETNSDGKDLIRVKRLRREDAEVRMAMQKNEDDEAPFRPMGDHMSNQFDSNNIKKFRSESGVTMYVNDGDFLSSGDDTDASDDEKRLSRSALPLRANVKSRYLQTGNTTIGTKKTLENEEHTINAMKIRQIVAVNEESFKERENRLRNIEWIDPTFNNCETASNKNLIHLKEKTELYIQNKKETLSENAKQIVQKLNSNEKILQRLTALSLWPSMFAALVATPLTDVATGPIASTDDSQSIATLASAVANSDGLSDLIDNLDEMSSLDSKLAPLRHASTALSLLALETSNFNSNITSNNSNERSSPDSRFNGDNNVFSNVVLDETSLLKPSLALFAKRALFRISLANWKNYSRGMQGVSKILPLDPGIDLFGNKHGRSILQSSNNTKTSAFLTSRSIRGSTTTQPGHHNNNSNGLEINSQQPRTLQITSDFPSHSIERSAGRNEILTSKYSEESSPKADRLTRRDPDSEAFIFSHGLVSKGAVQQNNLNHINKSLPNAYMSVSDRKFNVGEKALPIEILGTNKHSLIGENLVISSPTSNNRSIKLKGNDNGFGAMAVSGTENLSALQNVDPHRVSRLEKSIFLKNFNLVDSTKNQDSNTSNNSIAALVIATSQRPHHVDVDSKNLANLKENASDPRSANLFPSPTPPTSSKDFVPSTMTGTSPRTNKLSIMQQNIFSRATSLKNAIMTRKQFQSNPNSLSAINAVEKYLTEAVTARNTRNINHISSVASISPKKHFKLNDTEALGNSAVGSLLKGAWGEGADDNNFVARNEPWSVADIQDEVAINQDSKLNELNNLSNIILEKSVNLEEESQRKDNDVDYSKGMSKVTVEESKTKDITENNEKDTLHNKGIGLYYEP